MDRGRGTFLGQRDDFPPFESVGVRNVSAEVRGDLEVLNPQGSGHASGHGANRLWSYRSKYQVAPTL